MPVSFIELDHIFLMVPNQATAKRMFAKAGLRANYSRQHPGQGTSNLCAALDDMFIELLWLDGTTVSDASQRLQLAQRHASGLPLGISWRGTADVETQSYHPPYLPADMDIQVAKASDDPDLPLFFRSPGNSAPKDGDKALYKSRQQPKLSELFTAKITLPQSKATRELLEGVQKVEVVDGPKRSIEFLIQRAFKPDVVSVKWAF